MACGSTEWKQPTFCPTFHILNRCASLFELPNSIKIISLEKLTSNDKILSKNSPKNAD